MVVEDRRSVRRPAKVVLRRDAELLNLQRKPGESFSLTREEGKQPGFLPQLLRREAKLGGSRGRIAGSKGTRLGTVRACVVEGGLNDERLRIQPQ